MMVFTFMFTLVFIVVTVLGVYGILTLKKKNNELKQQITELEADCINICTKQVETIPISAIYRVNPWERDKLASNTDKIKDILADSIVNQVREYICDDKNVIMYNTFNPISGINEYCIQIDIIKEK